MYEGVLTDRERIRVGLEKMFGKPKLVDRALNYLNSQGVVLIDEDRELPTCVISEIITGNKQAPGCPFIKANYKPIKLLIEEQ